MRITVFGASGKVGRRLVEQAVKRGHTVVAVVHRHDPFTGTLNLIVRKADIYDATAVAAALKGSEAVISCLGSWGSRRRNVVTAAMDTIIPAMEQQGISRIVTLTGHGAQAPDQPAGLGHTLLLKLLAPFPAGKVFVDGEEHMRRLADSRLDWTCLRSPVMNNFGAKGYRLDLTVGWPFATIRRQAVATALLDELTANNFLVKAPALHRQ